MASRRDIEFILKTELEAARERCRATLEIRKTKTNGKGDHTGAAVGAYGEALQRFHDFVLHGAIPEDLLPFIRAETQELGRDGKENTESGE